ncbi:MAG TPA: GIY-YIG nuclease family protein [Candidatus Krumholzibacteria bacterium]|nr:GIY-YIG nuclease family protein [Candidatus Krumholzibacteria bacterium]
MKDDSSTAEIAAGVSASAAWFVYIVECADGTLYAGVARNAEARVAKHNDGSGAKYTRTRRPVELVYVEPVTDRGTALKREHEIKRMSAGEKRRLVEQQA